MFGRRRKAASKKDDLEDWLAEGPASDSADPPELGGHDEAPRRRSRDDRDEVRGGAPAYEDTHYDDAPYEEPVREEPQRDARSFGTFDDTIPAAGSYVVPEGPIGPWDITEVEEDDGIERIDLGALRVPAIPGLELRVDTDEEGRVMIVGLSHETGSLTLGAFAAPRSEGIWDEVREELATGIHDEGGRTEEHPGEYGTELLAEVQTPEHGLQPLRFVGIDGPRWFLRAVYSGPAAIDQGQVGTLGEALRNVVVLRGDDPMPVRDPLPLSLPQELVDQAAAAQAEQDAEDEGGRHRRLRERGPEITETR